MATTTKSTGNFPNNPAKASTAGKKGGSATASKTPASKATTGSKTTTKK